MRRSAARAKADIALAAVGAILIVGATIAPLSTSISQGLGFIGLMVIVIVALRRLAMHGGSPPGGDFWGGPPSGGHHGGGGGHHG
jgi:hypothetical protein